MCGMGGTCTHHAGVLGLVLTSIPKNSAASLCSRINNYKLMLLKTYETDFKVPKCLEYPADYPRGFHKRQAALSHLLAAI